MKRRDLLKGVTVPIIAPILLLSNIDTEIKGPSTRMHAYEALPKHDLYACSGEVSVDGSIIWAQPKILIARGKAP